MRTWPAALCAAILLALAVAIHSHHRAAAPTAAPAAHADSGNSGNSGPPPLADSGDSAASDPSQVPALAASQAAVKAPEPMPLAVALLPAPGPADASRQPAEANAAESDPDADPNLTASEPSPLAAHAAARDAALAHSTEDFFREAAEVLQQSPSSTAAALPVLTLRRAVAAAASPILALPLHAGRASLGWITRAIRVEHQLPSPNAVRLDEILNSFTLRPAGCAAICQGVSLTTESLPCPWKPSATLLVVSIRGAADASHDVTATFHADPATVARYRLLGFALPAGLDSSPLPTQILAKSLVSLVLEIVPSSTAPAFGSLEWSLDGQPAPAIPITHHRDAEPSDDARFAALVCAFAQWLAHDQSSLIDAEMLAALARETTSSTLPPDRSDFLTLIQETLDL
ncbi:MAG: von Willebrand factor type A domain-containing protein [Verrucomicrobiota bacterium]